MIFNMPQIYCECHGNIKYRQHGQLKYFYFGYILWKIYFPWYFILTNTHDIVYYPVNLKQHDDLWKFGDVNNIRLSERVNLREIMRSHVLRFKNTLLYQEQNCRFSWFEFRLSQQKITGHWVIVKRWSFQKWIQLSTSCNMSKSGSTVAPSDSGENIAQNIVVSINRTMTT